MNRLIVTAIAVALSFLTGPAHALETIRQNNPNPLKIYVDEQSFGSTSFQDRYGWDAATCPFGAVQTTSLSPARPSNLRLR